MNFCYLHVILLIFFLVCRQVISKDIDRLYMSGDDEERKAIQQTSQMFAAQITQLLFKVPRVLLLLLKTNDCLRSVDLALGEVRHQQQKCKHPNVMQSDFSTGLQLHAY